MENQEQQINDALNTLLLGYLYTGDQALLSDTRAKSILSHFTKSKIKARMNQLKATEDVG